MQLLTGMSEWLQILINGCIVGGIYALVALGYTMVYGILKFINFAHGEVFMVGAYVAYMLQDRLVMWQSVVVAMFICGLLGLCIERIAYRPLRGRDRLVYLITAVGVSLFLQSVITLLFGAQNRVIRPTGAAIISIGSATITSLQLLIIVIALVLMIALHMWVTYSRAGKAIRALSDNYAVAQTVGIPVNRLTMVVFIVGSMLAGAAGVLIAYEQSAVTPTIGIDMGIRAFTAAVLGGIGSIYGAFIGGFLIAIVENIGAYLLPAGYSHAIAFVVLIIILLVRPSGLFKGDGDRA